MQIASNKRSEERKDGVQQKKTKSKDGEDFMLFSL